jgi:hypothetical protein
MLSSFECFVWASCGIQAFGVMRILGLRAFRVVWVCGWFFLLLLRLGFSFAHFSYELPVYTTCVLRGALRFFFFFLDCK